VIAEKFEAMVQLGTANSRMKDFFDLAVIARTTALEGAMLADVVSVLHGLLWPPIDASARNDAFTLQWHPEPREWR
jgi:hypothetical protein